LFALEGEAAGALQGFAHNPDMPRPFRAPFMPVTAWLGIIISLGLMLGLPWQTWLRLVVWLGIGLTIYLAYGRRNSRLRRGLAQD
jgi:APA family basic amino acid/polyamine antiporter